jgi:putative nucleotidyltransferase with HDIG domain
MKIGSALGPAVAFAAPYLLFHYLKTHPDWDALLALPAGHFYIVSAVALLSTFIAIAVGISGSRVRNIKVSFLALAFISLAEVFAVHGLSTPDFLIHASHLPGVASQASILLASFWLWMSSLSSDSKLVLWFSQWKGGLVPVWSVALGLIGAAGLLFPHAVDMIPLDRSPLRPAATALIAALNLMTMYRYYQSYRYSRFPLQTAIIYSCGWMIVAQWIMVAGELWRISWWLYHVLLLASMIVMLAGLFRQYAVSRSLSAAVRALFTNDPIERITGSLSPSVKALIMATEGKDTYTAGHNLRVTLYALRLAEEMQLPPEQLRSLSQGTIIHDVGKINIPDAILNKPGRLTAEERMIIEQHPLKGYEMCRALGFMKEELSIIRSHHEKWDGTGYPDRLKGERIPLAARIVAVADVYDALTSTRAYRKAWSHKEAMQFLAEHRGAHFDPACVDAWIRICERDPQVYLYPLHVISDKKQAYPKSVDDDAIVS